MSGIESVLRETRSFAPLDTFRRGAAISGLEAYNDLCERADDDPLTFWADLARELMSWKKPFTKIFDDSQAPFFKWFEDGQLNVSYNCLDRHLDKNADKTALIFEADDGAVSTVSYRQLFEQVCRFANGLKSLGVGLGDRVMIYLPMGIQAIVAMQACARLGAIHSVVFGGFAGGALRRRILDTGAKLVITANEGPRGGKFVPLKATVDDALERGGCDSIEKVVVLRRTETPLVLKERDVWWHDLIEPHGSVCEPTWVGAEHPLFILYTSGSTGTPKGIQHASAGYLLGAANSFRWVFDHKPDDIFWCATDVGWITGHTYACYGPLALGATQVVFEGIPTAPDSGRLWRMIERHRVSVFYVASTVLRSLIKIDSHMPKRFDLSSLRLLGTMGEPITPDIWMWYYETVGGSRCPIVDTWWQTETGSAILAPLPGAVATKPGSCGLPLPGIQVDIVDVSGAPVEPDRGGFLVIKKPVPFLLRGLWNDPERFKKLYFPKEFNDQSYLAGDSANRDEDGYFWIMGRIDDVLNVSGHRLGTIEIESALMANPLVAEAAVVGRPDGNNGEALVAFVVLKGEPPSANEALDMAEDLKSWLAYEIGHIAQPDDIRFGENLPKTRSGKVMRRLLRSIAKGEEITQDVSMLENPQSLDQLQHPGEGIRS